MSKNNTEMKNGWDNGGTDFWLPLQKYRHLSTNYSFIFFYRDYSDPTVRARGMDLSKAKILTIVYDQEFRSITWLCTIEMQDQICHFG